MQTTATRERLRALIDANDLRGAVELLNSNGGHRFTSLYRFDGATLRNIVFFDRENPSVETTDAIPVLASYCVFVRDGGQTFRIDDATCDHRVDGHPKQAMVRSYCGVPLLDPMGRMFGTVCHFDFDAVPIDDASVDLLEAMAPLLYRASAADFGAPAP